MPSFNKVILVGNLTADPELKQTPSGVSVCRFTIAVQRRFGGRNVQGQTTADFFNVVAWRQSAEFVSRFFKKGRAILVCGQLQNNNWTDQQGNKRYATEVVADEVTFGAGKGDSQPQNTAFAGMGDFGSAPAYSAPASAPAVQPAAPKFEEIAGDEDLPF